MVRVMMFQSLSTSIGMTGWIFRMFCAPLRTEVQVSVVLEWDADQVADRILRELRELLGAKFSVRRSSPRQRCHQCGGGEQS
jgi:hypothetical protein